MSRYTVVSVNVGDLKVGDVVFAGYRKKEDARRKDQPYGYRITTIHKLPNNMRRILTDSSYFGDFDDHVSQTTRVIREEE